MMAAQAPILPCASLAPIALIARHHPKRLRRRLHRNRIRLQPQSYARTLARVMPATETAMTAASAPSLPCVTPGPIATTAPALLVLAAWISCQVARDPRDRAPE